MPVDLQTSDKFDEKSQGADWFGWSTYFTVGLLVGVAFGYFRFIHLRFNHSSENWLLGRIWLNHDDIIPFILGMGLLIGAIFSQMKRFRRKEGSYSSFLFPHKVKQSPASVLCSIVIGIIGIGLMVFATMRTLNYMGGLG